MTGGRDQLHHLVAAARVKAAPLVRTGVRRLGYELVRAPTAGAPQDDLARTMPDIDADTRATVSATVGLTLTSPERVAALCAAVRHVVEAGVPGALVECGVWRGGSVLAILRTLLSLQATDRDVYLFDTFDSMPAPGELDVDLVGVSAASYHAQFDAGMDYDPAYDYLPFETVRRLLLASGYPEDRLHFIVGLVEDTVPRHAPPEVALLRLDTDYYASTRHELEHLAPRLAPGGVLIVDDYGHWLGSRQATDEYLAARRAAGVHLYLHRVDYSARLVVMPR